MKKIIITGSAGFIGYHLTNLLAKSNNYEIIAIDNINSYYDIQLKLDRLEQLGISKDLLAENQPIKSLKYKNLVFYKTDLNNFHQLEKIFKHIYPEVVCHLAAQAGVRYSISHPEEYISNNINAFFNILKLSTDFSVHHLVYASSSSVYGLTGEQIYSEHQSTEKPISLYAATKKSNELLAHVYSHIYQIYTTGLRFFTVYGPWGRPDMAPILFSKAILSGEAIQVFNNGHLERDFTYIDDIVKGVESVINKDINLRDEYFKIYNIGRGKPEKLMHFISELEKSFGITAQKEYLEMQKGDVLKTFADISELKNDFGYSPQTNIEKGIPEFVKWFKIYYDYN
jgi:UDP-glucuronate 4-epimerase